MKTKILLVLAAAMALAACRPAAVVPPVVVPAGEDRYLIDPRTGFNAPEPPEFELAWRHLMAGNEAEARRRIADIRAKYPSYLPALLAEAAMEMRAGNLDAAGAAVAEARQKAPEGWPAPRVYEAEIAWRRGDTRSAFQLYRDLAGQPGAPEFVPERLNALQTRLFNDLVAQAAGSPDANAVALLREALTFNPAAMDVRVMLAGRLVNLGHFEEARREIAPVLDTPQVDQPAVQEILAEIDVGRGRYQEAIVRYERLSRRFREERRYAERLERIKEQWSMANMPPQFRQAMESPAVTRSDFAVLLYWLVPSVRFAQNLDAPPIAIDLENAAGREEIIRAIAIGLYDVDPVTRRVSPGRVLSAARISVQLQRLLMLRGAPCARGLQQTAVLSACGVADPGLSVPGDATLTGREVARALEQVAKALQ